MDREKLASQEMADVFSLRFADGKAAGKGAPNRYTAPYTAGPDGTMKIGPVAATLMMGIIQPDGITESDYFALLGTVAKWRLTNGKLELVSPGSDASDSVLVYSAGE
jgi:heat shock protein HslJ